MSEEIDILDLPVFCINLDRRLDRWQQFRLQEGVREIPNLQRFSAVDGQTISMDDERIGKISRMNIVKKTRRSHDEINTMGAVGAALSHSTIWKIFLEEYPHKEYCVIFEDDVRIPAGLADAVKKVSKRDLDELEDGFDIWLLQYTSMNKKTTPLTQHWSSPENFHGFCGYIVSRRGAKRLLESAYPIEMHIDRYANMKKDMNELIVVCNRGVRIFPRRSMSDIQDYDCELCNLPDTLSTSPFVVLKKRDLLTAGVIGGCFVLGYFLIKR